MAERYVLGNLSRTEVEDFERHFFDCPVCAQDLRLFEILRVNSRAVFNESPSLFMGNLRETRRTQRSSDWRRGFISRWQLRTVVAGLAGITLSVLAGYETGIRHEVNSAQVVSAYPLYAPSRGRGAMIEPSPAAHFYALYMDRTWEHDYRTYRAVVRDADSGIERLSMRLTASEADHAIYVLTPARALTTGGFVLMVLGRDEGGEETELARYPFTVKLR